MSRWMTRDEIDAVGFERVGHGCKISTGAEFIGAQNISIGDNTRIDTGALFLAGSEDAYLRIGSHCHIASRSVFMASGGILIGDFAAVGIMSKLISASDDFSGNYLIGPVFSREYINVKRDPIVLEDHAVVTTDCTVLPGSTLREGAVLGAMALLKGESKPWAIHVGVPAKPRGVIRSRKALALGDRWRQQTVWSPDRSAEIERAHLPPDLEKKLTSETTR